MAAPATLLDGHARNAIRDAIAAAALATAKALGSQIGLAHDGEAEVILWCLTDQDSTNPHMVSGLVVEPERRRFEIPRQAADARAGTGAFTGAISENDIIRWVNQVTAADRYYTVPAGEGSWDMTGLEAVYNVTALAKLVRRAGP
jgi:hypothetical protein